MKVKYMTNNMSRYFTQITKVLTGSKLSKPTSVLLKSIKLLSSNAYSIVLRDSFPFHHNKLRKYNFLIIRVLEQ